MKCGMAVGERAKILASTLGRGSITYNTTEGKRAELEEGMKEKRNPTNKEGVQEKL